MDEINIFEALFGTSLRCPLRCSRVGPWYADLFHSNGSFYQLLAHCIPEDDKRGIMRLNFYRSETNNKASPLMSGKALFGDWWYPPYHQSLRTLSRFRTFPVGVETLVKEFVTTVKERLQHGYQYKILCVDNPSTLSTITGISQPKFDWMD